MLTLVPPYNPIKFNPPIAGSDVRFNFGADKGNYIPWELTNYEGSIRSFQTPIAFQQPWQNNDVIFLQIHAQQNAIAAKPLIRLLDHLYNKVGADINYLETVSNPNNIYYDDSGNTIVLDTFDFKLNLTTLLGGNNGIYYLQIINQDDNGNSETLTSETQRILPVQKGTVLIQYSDNINKLEMIVSGLRFYPVFTYRVHADVRKMSWKAVMMSYLGQGYDNVTLNSDSYIWNDFQVGVGGVLVPDYVLNTLSNIFIRDNIQIQGVKKQSVVSNGTSQDIWNIKRDSNSPLCSASTPIRELRKTDTYAFAAQSTVVLFNSYLSSNALPYAIGHYRMIFNGSPINMQAQVFYTTADETAYLTFLNGTVAPANGMTGSFNKIAGQFIYTCGVGELLRVFSPVVYVKISVLSVFVQNTIVTSGHSIQSFQYYSFGGTQVIDWGDATIQEYTSTGSLPNAHNYDGGGSPLSANYSINIFHNDAMTSLRIIDAINVAGSVYGSSYGSSYTDSSNVSILTNLTGVLPSSLIQLILIGDFSALSAFDITPLNYCQTTLKTLQISANVVAWKNGATTGFFTMLTNFNNLNTIFWNGNALPASTIDAEFNNFPLFNSFPTGGAFFTRGQTPPAPPTSASLAARNFIISFGWNVLTD